MSLCVFGDDSCENCSEFSHVIVANKVHRHQSFKQFHPFLSWNIKFSIFCTFSLNPTAVRFLLKSRRIKTRSLWDSYSTRHVFLALRSQNSYILWGFQTQIWSLQHINYMGTKSARESCMTNILIRYEVVKHTEILFYHKLNLTALKSFIV